MREIGRCRGGSEALVHDEHLNLELEDADVNLVKLGINRWESALLLALSTGARIVVGFSH